jgi:hypothetical protein
MLGDYNSYAKEDPITALATGGYTNLVESFVGPDAYSYVFDGQWGYLDHALGSASLAGQVTGVADYHIDADEPSVLDYNTDFKTPDLQATLYAPDQFRISDHDPVVVGLAPNAPPTVDAGGPYTVVEGDSVTVTATGSDPDGDTLTYAWDLDNDGTFETTGQSATFAAPADSAPATFTIKVQATDPGGLTATDSATVTVTWQFTGFFAPVDPAPTFNVVKAGQAVPVKFSLGGDQGLAIFATGPAPTLVPCPSSAVVDTVEETVAGSASSLRYDSATGQYIYVWKTERTWAGTCRALSIELTDGTTHRALFKFTR